MAGDRQELDRAYAVALLRLYLEVERGLRPARTLRPLLTAKAYQRLTTPGVISYVHSATPGTADIGRLIVQRRGRQVWATAPVRDTNDRWGAVVLAFQADRAGRHKITTLERVQARELPPSGSPADPAALVDAAMKGATMDLQAAEVALHTERQRGPDAAVRVERWQRRVDALHQEIDRLRRSQNMLRPEKRIDSLSSGAGTLAYRRSRPLGRDNARGLDR